MAILTRETTATGVTNNGAPLTNAQVDNNFVELQQNKLEDITSESIEDLSDVNTMTPTDGQLLTWDQTNLRWDAADAPVSLPSQTGNAGKYLTTDGTTASWAVVLTDKSTDGGFANSVYTADQLVDGGNA